MNDDTLTIQLCVWALNFVLFILITAPDVSRWRKNRRWRRRMRRLLDRRYR